MYSVMLAVAATWKRHQLVAIFLFTFFLDLFQIRLFALFYYATISLRLFWAHWNSFIYLFECAVRAVKMLLEFPKKEISPMLFFINLISPCTEFAVKLQCSVISWLRQGLRWGTFWCSQRSTGLPYRYRNIHIFKDSVQMDVYFLFFFRFLLFLKWLQPNYLSIIAIGFVLSCNFSKSPWSKNSSATSFATRCWTSHGFAMALTSQAVIIIPQSTATH